jgi:hypothetical protein
MQPLANRAAGMPCSAAALVNPAAAMPYSAAATPYSDPLVRWALFVQHALVS